MLSRKKIFITLAGLAVIYGLWWRISNLERPLIYDEIWGLTHWIKRPIAEILTLFNNQNNHPLNSVWMKLAHNWSSRSLITLRLHSFIAGLLIPLFTAIIAWLLTRRRFIVLLAIFLTALHPGLIYYSQVARGYALQTAAVMLFYLLIVCYQYYRKLPSKIITALAAGLIISFLIACFSLATAILYLTPAIAAHLIYLFLKPAITKQQVNWLQSLRTHAILLCGYAVITLAAAWIYLGHYEQFKAAVPAGGGDYIKSSTDFLTLIIKRGQALLSGPIWLSALFPLACKKYRSIALLAWAMVIPALLAAIIIKVGPTRVYLPLVPSISIAAATGLHCLTLTVPKYRGKLQIVIALVLLGYAVWHLPNRYLTWAAIDWRPIITTIDRQYPATSSYRCYPANEGLPISAGLPREVNNNIKPFYNGMRLINFGQDKTFEGLDNSNGIARLSFKSDIAPKKIIFANGIVANIYRLRKLNSNSRPRSNIILAEIQVQPVVTARAAVGYLRSYDSWYLLNCWFNPIRQTADKRQQLLSFQLISEAKKMSISQLTEIEQRSGGRVRFYWLEAVRQKK